MSLASKAVGVGVAALATAPVMNAAVFNVDNLNDGGSGSLRDAISQANSTPGADVITFDAALTGTITLSTQHLYITDSVDIQGPGASVITVSGGGTSRVFYLYSGSEEINVRIEGLTISGGSAGFGAGIAVFGEDLELEGVTLTQNASLGRGGGLGVDNDPVSDITIRNSTISDNTSDDDGAGIYLSEFGTLTIENSVISGNQAVTDGGGIYLYSPNGDVNIVDTEVSGNLAAFGGGLFLYQTGGGFTIERSTFSGNDASDGAAMFFYVPLDPINIVNSTISGNDAASDGGGMFFYDLYSGLNVNFTTVANNTAVADGGGMFAEQGGGDISNSIFADNTAGFQPDIGGSISVFDTRYTLIEGGETDAMINDIEGNIFGVDPQLSPLADNGGSTETHLPALTSPVVNAADPAFVAPPVTDQRGAPRVYPTRADMGAVELVGGAIQFDPASYIVNENAGTVTLTVVRDIGTDEATVEYTTNAGTATPGAGNDYTTTSGTLTFAPGDLSETFDVPILDDPTVEGDEQFTATLDNPSVNATIGANDEATVTINDVEGGQFVFSSATYSGSESGGNITITVNRVGGSDGAASVFYSMTPGTATGADYTDETAMLSWDDGDSSPRQFDIAITNDVEAEGDETFTVELSQAGNGTIGTPGEATVTIVDDPVGTAQFSTAVINTAEEAGSVTVTVTRTGGTEGELIANYATANGTATAPTDYVPAASFVSFPAGDATPQTFNIGLVNDAVEEPAEAFSVTLDGTSIGTPSTVTINLAASDEASIAGIPTLSWWGKMLMMVMSAFAGLYVMVRNRFSMFLVGLLLIGMAAAPQLSAQQKTKAAPAKTKVAKANAATDIKRNDPQGPRYIGRIQSVQDGDASLVLTLEGGQTVTVPKAKAQFVDARSGKPRPGTAQLLSKGVQVRVKFRLDKEGQVKHVKVKLIG